MDLPPGPTEPQNTLEREAVASIRFYEIALHFLCHVT